MPPLPPPLPPESRTVGQLVAETIRLYRENFWPSLALGLAPAGLDILVELLPKDLQLQAPAGVGVGSVVMTISFIGATVIATGAHPGRKSVWNAFVAGLLIWPPAALFPLLFALSGNIWIALLGLALPSLSWLAYVGLAVPAAVVEDLDYRHAIGRGMELGRVDFVHALGGLATLVIAFALSKGVLFALLQGQAKIQVLSASFVADFVLSPMLFLGAALLYVDQRARLDKLAPATQKGEEDADLHHAVDADGAGRPDAEVESRSAARGES